MRPTVFVLVSLVFAGFFARVIPHPFNFTPIIAMALVAGVFARPRWLALALPLGAMFVSDLVLNNTVYAHFYEGFRLFGDAGAWLGIGLCALLPVLLGTGRGASWTKLLGTGVGGAVLFFMVSNVMVWATSAMYPLNAAGLGACLAAGLPFFPNTLISTLVFGGASVAVLRGVGVREAKPDVAQA